MMPVRKLFLSKPGGDTIYRFDKMGTYCYYCASGVASDGSAFASGSRPEAATWADICPLSIHAVEGAWFPNWIGRNQVRRYRFSGNTVTLEADAPDWHATLIWRRIE